MKYVKRLEKFWRNLVLTIPSSEDVNGAVITCYPNVPMLALNHAADINVKENEAGNLLNKVTEYFSSKSLPYACFRISPATRPKSFVSLLEIHCFKRKTEDSVMIFKRKQVKQALNPETKVKEISNSEMETYVKLLLEIFEMPMKWKKGLDKLFLESMRKGWRFYLAYVERKPVGTCALVSSAKTGGIFNVGTLKEYRRRGIGTTLTVKALMDSIAEGNELHTLQTEKGGNAEKLYRKIGFKIDHTTSFFVENF